MAADRRHTRQVCRRVLLFLGRFCHRYLYEYKAGAARNEQRGAGILAVEKGGYCCGLHGVFKAFGELCRQRENNPHSNAITAVEGEV